jgi:dynactin complex subunit
MKHGTLLTTTIELLKADPRTLRMVSQATAIPYYWLKKLSAGEINDPSVNRIQQLFEFLSKKRLLD